MKRLLPLVLFAWATCSAATYYVDCAAANDLGAGTAPGTAWKNITKANTTATAGDTVLLIRGCSWAQTITPAANTITYGAYGTGLLPIITGSGGFGLNATGRTGIVFANLDFNGSYVYAASSATVTGHHSLMRNSATYGAYVISGGSLTLYACDVVANGTFGIYISATGTNTVTVRNSIIAGNGAMSTSITNGVYIGASSTFDYGNSYIGGNGRGVTTWYSSTGTRTDSGGNITTNVLPGFVGYYQDASPKFVLTMDGDAYATIGDVIHAYATGPLAGVAWTAYLSYYDLIPAGQITSLQDIVANHTIVELGAHGYSHSAINTTTAFTVSTTNSGTNTVSVDRTTSTISLTSSGNPENNVSYNWTSTSTLCAFKQAVQASFVCSGGAATGKGWTITNTTNVNNYARTKGIATQSSTTLPYAVTWSMNDMYAAETDACATWMIANLSTTPTSFAYGGGWTDANAQEYQRASGVYASSRNAGVGTSALSSVKIHNLWASNFAAELGIAADETATRALARRYILLARMANSHTILFWHTSSDVTDNQLGWFVNEVQNNGGTFVTMGQLAAAIRADHSTADSGATWTKTYIDGSNYRLGKGSPLMYMGADLGATYKYGLDPRSLTDIQTLDNTLFGWDIGAFVRIKRGGVVGN